MNYFYKCINSTNSDFSEQLTDSDSSTSATITIPDSLIIQFLSVFSEEEYLESSPPIFLQILLSEFCNQTLIQKLRKKELDNMENRYSNQTRHNIAREHFHYFEKILSNPSLNYAIAEWWNNPQNRKLIYNKAYKQIPHTRGINIDEISALIINSPMFKTSVALYIDMRNTESNPFNFFSHNFYTSRLSNRDISLPLHDESKKIRLLYEFIVYYYLNNNSAFSINDLKYDFEKFYKEYLNVNLDSLRVRQKELQIENALKSLMSTPPNYMKRVINPNFEFYQASKIYSKYISNHINLNNVAKVSLAENALLAYIEEKEILILSKEQERALHDLSNLLSNIVTASNYYHSIFHEFELIKSLGPEIGYKFSDYLEACCVSLFNHVSAGLSIKRCSLCGRYYIAKQNRSSTDNYCYRTSFQNPKQSCSSYHSHSQSRYNGGHDFQELNTKICNIRTYLTKMANDNRYIDLNDCIYFLRDGLRIIRNYAKQCDQSGENFKDAVILVDQIEKCRKLLSKNDIETIKTIKNLYDMFKDNLTFFELFHNLIPSENNVVNSTFVI